VKQSRGTKRRKGTISGAPSRVEPTLPLQKAYIPRLAMQASKSAKVTLDGTKKLLPSAFMLKRAWQSAFTVLVFFNREPFFELRQLLRDEFSIR
jgi:hypothetical protein